MAIYYNLQEAKTWNVNITISAINKYNLELMFCMIIAVVTDFSCVTRFCVVYQM